jgi:hypothetical protein
LAGYGLKIRKEKTMKKKTMLVEVPHDWSKEMIGEFLKYFQGILNKRGYSYEILGVPGAITILELPRK